MTDASAEAFPGVHYWAVYECVRCGHIHRWANEKERAHNPRYHCPKCPGVEMRYKRQEQETSDDSHNRA